MSDSQINIKKQNVSSAARHQGAEQHRELVIIDPSVPDYQTLLSGISPNAEVHILDKDRDGITQIVELLAKTQQLRTQQLRTQQLRTQQCCVPTENTSHPSLSPLSPHTPPTPYTLHPTPLPTLHLISHGAPGTLYLGNSTLELSNIEQYRPQLQKWNIPHLYIYGCKVAAGDAGEEFLQKLHQLTGAQIYANPHLTGHFTLGGTWNLQPIFPPTPYTLHPTPLSPHTLATYPHTLGFNTQTTFAVGTNPASVAVEDVDGDGNQDLAVANSDLITNPGGGNVSVLLGDGSGSFNSQTTFAAGSNPTSVAVAHFNSDGNQDLAVANGISSNVSVLLGDGSGSFNFQTNASAGTSPASVTVADFNSDGNQDLAVANLGVPNVVPNIGVVNPGNVSVFLGTGNGSFNSQTTFAAGTNPASVAVGDFDSDGKQDDLAVANGTSNNVSVLLGDGSGSFSTQTTFAVGTNPASVAVGDFDGDGNQDLAVANGLSNNVSVLLGDGNGGFNSQTTFAVGSNPASVAVGDFDGDGNKDLAVANTGGGNVSVLLGDGSGGFSTQTTFAVGTNPTSVAVGDFDGDGKEDDLAVANGISNNVSVLLNNTAKVTAVTATTNDGSYNAGDTIDITVTFDAAVAVDTTGGTPRLQLETGTTDQYATYASGTGTNTLTFNYVVQAGDSTTDLEYLSTTALELNGGTIKESAASGFDAFLTLPNLGTANSLGGSKAIVVDTVAPTVALSSNAGGTVNAPFTVTATFSEAVSDFDLGDISVSNATTGNFNAVSATEYTFEVTPTADGQVTVDLAANSATDSAANGNTAATQLTQTADITAPIAPTIGTTGTTNDSTPDITGTAEANSSVNILLDGTSIGTTTADASGNWTLTPTSAIADGTYDVTATATDAAGNASVASAASSVTVNTVAPAQASAITPFTGPSILVSENTDNNQTNSTSEASPASIPAAPTVDLGNISPTAVGTDGVDNTDGQATSDVIDAGAGNDTLRGLGGDDTLIGGLGNDEIQGNQGADLLSGNQGDDTIYSGAGNDIAYGGQDNDLIYGDKGSDTISGDLGNDTLFGGASTPENMPGDGADLLLGGDGNDYLNGNLGNDSLSGGIGDDTAYGGQGDDLIDGGAGSDVLYGNLGNDTLIGGNGTDYFAIQAGFAAVDADVAIDFTDGDDLIGLADGLTFADLSITGSNGNTLISSNNELLLTLTGIDVSLINNADFVLL